MRKFVFRFLAIVLLCGVLAGETTGVVLSARAIDTSDCVMLDVPWEYIQKCGNQVSSGNTKACQAYAFTYCRMILDDTYYPWTKYRYGSSGQTACAPSTAGYNDCTNTTSEQSILKAIYDNINLGRPVMLRAKGSVLFHYVVAIGYKASCNPNKLSQSDFIILDPWDGQKKSLSAVPLKAKANGEYGYWTAKTGGVSVNNNVETCTVTFDNNDGSAVQTTKTVTRGALIGTVPTPTRAGYQFLGWSEAPTGSGMIVTSNNMYVEKNITLYALWRTVAKSYTVTFDAKGGSVSQRTMTVTNGSAFGTLPTPARDGYEFNGWWYDDDDSGVCVRVRSNTRVDLERNITLYATWSQAEPEEEICITHKKGPYLYCDDEHPHYNSYLCSVCGEEFQDGSKKEIDSCTVCNPVEETPVVCKTHTKGTLASIDGKHPHYNYYTCSVCGVKYKDGSTKKLTSCTVCYPKECEVHKKGEMLYCETAHPHRNYYECSVCGAEFTDGITNEVNSCKECNLLSEPAVCKNHKKGDYRRSSPAHPHYNYYECSACGEEFTDKSTASIPSCEDCWDDWSSWSATKVSATFSRQVETKKVKLFEGYTEYRYGRYIDEKGAHDCWCGEYLESLSYVSGNAKLDYSDWSKTRYSENGKGWTCGYCDADHIGEDKTGSDGRSWWAEYVLPGSESYYWEESRTVDATYVTMYRYRELKS